MTSAASGPRQVPAAGSFDELYEAALVPVYSYLFHRSGGVREVAEDLTHSSSEKRYYCFGQVGGGVLTVRFTFREGVIRIFGAGYWRRGKRIYERENQIHR